MDTVKETLLKELKKLKAEEFNDFKFYLEEYGSKVQRAYSKDTGNLSIAPCDLENADRRKTVDLIVQTYSSQPLEVAQQVLEKVGRHDVMMSLQQSDRGKTTNTEFIFNQYSYYTYYPNTDSQAGGLT